MIGACLKLMRKMAQSSNILPPIRKSRPRSSIEKGCWNRVLSIQRKMSVDRLTTSSLSGVSESSNSVSCQQKHEKVKQPNNNSCNTQAINSRKVEKQKVCPRLARSVRGETILEIIKNKDTNNQNADECDTVRDNQNEVTLMGSNSLIGDDPFVLEATLLLGKIDKYKLNQGKDPQILLSRQSRQTQLDDCKHQLQKLLLEKVRAITENDCLLLTHQSLNYVHKLESIYTEDKYKLTTAENYHKLSDKERKLAIGDFVETADKRRHLPKECDERIKGWIGNIRNCQRLLNISYQQPKERLCVLLLEKTAHSFDRTRTAIAYWLSLILETNMKIVANYWDNLPFECLCNVFHAIITFNRTFSDHRIDPIVSVAAIHAKAAANRISLLIFNDVKKLSSVKGTESCNGQLDFKCKSGDQEDTSDYYTETASSNNSSKPGTSTSPSNNHLDLFNYLNNNSSSGQRIVVKLSFAAQHALMSSQHAPSKQVSPLIANNHTTNRQTWAKLDSRGSVVQKQLFHSFDSVYWPKYWSCFVKKLHYNLLYVSRDNSPSLPFDLCHPDLKALIYESFRHASHNCDVFGTAKGLSSLSDKLFYEILTYSWLQIHRQFFNNIEDNTQRVYGRYDKVFVQSFEKVFSDMVLFTLKDAKGEVMSCRKIMVSRQLEYLVKMLEAYVQSLPSEIELVSLLDFVKQLKSPSRTVTSLEMNSNCYPSSLVASFDNSMKLLHEKIEHKIYDQTLEAICGRIASATSQSIDLSKPRIVSHVIETYLEPNLEVVRSFNIKRPPRLYYQIIESFSRALVVVLTSKLKLKSNQQLKALIKHECNLFVDKYESLVDTAECGREFEQLKSLCRNQKHKNLQEISLWSRDNRIQPSNQLLPKSKSSHELTVSDCGCFC